MNYLVYLHTIWLTHKKLSKIFEENNDYKWVFEDFENDNFEKYNIWENESIKKWIKKLDKKKIDKILKELDVKIVTIHDKNYPKYLKEIPNPPYFLYVRWDLEENQKYFWVVWSRKITPYAKKAWETIIPDLAFYFNIVSWWAWWCDSLAHEICVKNWLKTTVIFGTWIDITYPVANESLFKDVLKNNWCLISIFPIWTIWSNFTFPVRNEIVSWMSDWILVLQAAQKSWTLITANLALDQWKDLFVIPWDIFKEEFVWCNDLIKNWNAKLVTNSSDILEEYSFKIIKKEKEVSFRNNIEKDIFNLLKYNISLSIDEFLEKTSYNYGEISLNISMMEISWIIKKDDFGKYTLSY